MTGETVLAAFRPLATKRVDMPGGGSVVVRELTGTERDVLYAEGLAKSAPSRFHATVVAMALTVPGADYTGLVDDLVSSRSPDDVLAVSTVVLELSGLRDAQGDPVEAALGN